MSFLKSMSIKGSEITAVSRDGKLRLSQEGLQCIFMTASGYGKHPNHEWIEFDEKPILWRPKGYRGDIIRVGYNYIMLNSTNGVDVIHFAKDADKLLRQAIRKLF